EEALGVVVKRAALAVEHHRVGEVRRVFERFAERDLGRVGDLEQLAERGAGRDPDVLVDVVPAPSDAALDEDVDADAAGPEPGEDSHRTRSIHHDGERDQAENASTYAATRV